MKTIAVRGGVPVPQNVIARVWIEMKPMKRALFLAQKRVQGLRRTMEQKLQLALAELCQHLCRHHVIEPLLQRLQLLRIELAKLPLPAAPASCLASSLP